MVFRKFNITLSKRSCVDETLSKEFYLHGTNWCYEFVIHDNKKVERLELRGSYGIELDSVSNTISKRHASSMRINIDNKTRDEMSGVEFDDDSYITMDGDFCGVYVDMDVWDIDSMILADTGVSLI